MEGFAAPGNAPSPFGGGSSNLFGSTTYPVDIRTLQRFGGLDQEPAEYETAQRGARALAENMNLPAIEQVRNKKSQFDVLMQALGLQSKGGDVRNGSLASLFGQGGEGDASASGSYGGDAGDYDALYSKLSTLMGQRGSSYEDDINQSANETSKSAAARMAARGLGGSTLVDASNARVTRDKNSALNKLHDTLLGQDIGTLSSVGIEGLKAKQRKGEFTAQMKLAGGDQKMKMIQTLLGM